MTCHCINLYGIKYVEMDGENGKIKPVIDMVETMESNKNMTFLSRKVWVKKWNIPWQ